MPPQVPRAPSVERKWEAAGERAARALLREEGKALRALRLTVKAAKQRVVYAAAILPPGSRRRTAEATAALMRSEGATVAREIADTVRAFRLSTKTTSLVLFGQEWDLVRREVVRAGFAEPGPLAVMATVAPTDDTAAARTGQSFGAQWTTSVMAAAWTWADGDAASLAPALDAIDMDGRVRRIAATDAAQAFEDARDEGMGWIAEEHGDTRWFPAVGKRWEAKNDKKVCPVCASMAVRRPRPIGIPWPGGVSPGYAHSFCRCIEGLVWLPVPLAGKARPGRQVDNENPRGPGEAPLITFEEASPWPL